MPWWHARRSPGEKRAAAAAAAAAAAHHDGGLAGVESHLAAQPQHKVGG
jgi:hypothetical protein